MGPTEKRIRIPIAFPLFLIVKIRVFRVAIGPQVNVGQMLGVLIEPDPQDDDQNEDEVFFAF